MLKIQSGHDCVHRHTDGQTNGQGETSIPPFQLRWSGVIINSCGAKFILVNIESHCIFCHRKLKSFLCRRKMTKLSCTLSSENHGSWWLGDTGYQQPGYWSIFFWNIMVSASKWLTHGSLMGNILPNLNSLVPRRPGCYFKKCNFQSRFIDWYLHII